MHPAPAGQGFPSFCGSEPSHCSFLPTPGGPAGTARPRGSSPGVGGEKSDSQAACHHCLKPLQCTSAGVGKSQALCAAKGQGRTPTRRDGRVRTRRREWSGDVSEEQKGGMRSMTREHRPATEEGRCTTERISLFAISLVAAWPPGTRTASWKSAGKGCRESFTLTQKKM